MPKDKLMKIFFYYVPNAEDNLFNKKEALLLLVFQNFLIWKEDLKK